MVLKNLTFQEGKLTFMACNTWYKMNFEYWVYELISQNCAVTYANTCVVSSSIPLLDK